VPGSRPAPEVIRRLECTFITILSPYIQFSADETMVDTPDIVGPVL
jgi:hypothetical protein